MKPAVDFFFFYGSIYTYLAVMRIETLARDSGSDGALAAIQPSPASHRAGQHSLPTKSRPDGLLLARC
jgi:2-hydroxychromene-2-carboxylate isomerase